jgi:hypothetical protein
MVGRLFFVRNLKIMFLIYVDEAGSSDPHKEPLIAGQTPLFVIASLAFQADEWRKLDREYRDLKVKFFKTEIGSNRPEQYEVKGSDLTRPSNRHSRRRHTFLRHALQLCLDHNATGFAVVFRKGPLKPTAKASLYNMGMQYAVERFGYFMDEVSAGVDERFPARDCRGIIIADSRMRNLDRNVAISHLSYVFGHSVGKQATRIVEAPTFTFSDLSVGIQLTDIFASAIYAKFYQRMCAKTVPGAIDYSHMQYADEYTDQLQWRARRPWDGYYVRGYRIIDHSVPP